jgi:antitoxin component YwqK of YwqJK toxin-antitoxin module
MKYFFRFVFFLFLFPVTVSAGSYYPKDSGAYNTLGLKTGKWVEYFVDSFHDYPMQAQDIERTMLFMNAKVVLHKQTGPYKNGRREGVWSYYNCYSSSRPFEWIFKQTIAYKAGSYNGPWKYYSVHGDLLFQTTQKNGKLDGIYTAYYPGKKIKSVTHYKNGVRNGNEKFYSPNGKLDNEKEYSNGYLSGTYKQYYDNGQLMFQREFKNGIVWNQSKMFDKSGNPLATGTLNNGVGTINLYTEYGKLIVIYSYENGVKNGPATEYHRGGKIISRKMNYVNDTLDGEIKHYDAQGKLTQISNLKKGKQDGHDIFFYENGKMWADYIYKDDMIRSVIMFDRNGAPLDAGTLTDGTGSLKIYDDSSRLIHTFEYSKGMRNGIHRSFNTDGKIAREENFVNDSLHGLVKIFHENGKLWTETTIVNGGWEGVSNIYYESGKKYGEYVYKNGRLWNVNFILDTTGKKISFGNFRDGSGLIKMYSDSGNVTYTIEHDNGVRNGKTTSFYKNGAIRRIQNYVNDTVQGQDISYYPNGVPSFITEYKNGKKNGPSRVYYPDGKLWTERIYANNLLMEVTVNYNSSGKKVDKGTIKNGNGTVNQYDLNGVLVATVMCVDGYVAEWGN